MPATHDARPPASNTMAWSLAARYFLVLVAGLGLAGCQRVTSDVAQTTTGTKPAPGTGVSLTVSAEGKGAEKPECCAGPKNASASPVATAGKSEAEVLPGEFHVPRALLIDQDGKPVNLYDDLVKGRVVIMNFLFTTCRGICPPLGANFGGLQKELGDELGREISLISISVDPLTDTPQRLKAWSNQFGAQRGWTLLTGPKADVDSVLKSLGVFSANKSDHSPFLLIGSEGAGHWTRIHGLTPPGRVAEIARRLVRENSSAGGTADGSRTSVSITEVPSSAAHTYFTDVTLTNQRGEPMRLYSDLLHDRIVVIHCFFAECRGSCPRMMTTFARIQDHLADRMGKDVHLLSISVDPGRDTPERLAEYAEGLKVRPGWFFLTGDRKDVDAALQKLGLRVDARESHSNVFLIGNLRTGLWKKAIGLADPNDLIAIVDGVLDDPPTTPDSASNPSEEP